MGASQVMLFDVDDDKVELKSFYAHKENKEKSE